MNKLTAVYPLAVEHTKKKVMEDIQRYLEEKETMPSFEKYLEERQNYVEQIWVNVWLNKITNDVSKREKKSFLSERNYEVDGVDRKIINRLFRNEMRDYRPFAVVEWITTTFTGHEKEWQELYEQAKVNLIKRKEEEQIVQKQKEISGTIESVLQQVLEKDQEELYLYIRHRVSQQLASDFKTKPKYRKIETFKIEEELEEIGSFSPSDYFTVSKFFDELTGAVQKAYYWEYERYLFAYQRFINEKLRLYVSRLVLERLSEQLYRQYEEAYNQPLSEVAIRLIVKPYLSYWEKRFFSNIQLELLEDLLHLADIPFDLDVHRKKYQQDLIERERKKAEEEAEAKRKREEEARILDDIFGREYRPSAGRNIRYVLHIGETNTGKTHHALERMKAAKSGLYLAPLRLLALEVYDKLNAEGVPCILKTGEEEKIVEGAHHNSCTVEMFHEKEFYDVVVIDEAQMIADKDRGFSWYKAVTKAHANEVHIIGSRNAETMVLQLLGDSEDIEIHDYTRDIPLKVERKEFKISHTKKGDALVCFSRRRVLETASQLQKNGHSVSMIYGSMPPETRKKQMQRFIDGETTVIVSTDAIGMGLNLPIRRIAFLENEKFDGTRRRRLTSQEIKQIAGRAGRKGIYDIGKVAFTSEIKLMKHLLQQEDESIQTFAIAPTNAVFERFQKYYRDLGTFFELWDKFESPKGTKKASLSEERELYETIRNTEIEARLSMMDLYGFLHLPFSSKEPGLTEQWQEKMIAIVRGNDLPEPQIVKGSLEELELSYKSIGLHLLFLYRLERRTEAIYWERIREEISDGVHEVLKNDVRTLAKTCKYCGKNMSWEHEFTMCDECHKTRYKQRERGGYRNRKYYR
ncbi:helicase-related protein [Alkalihalobacillus sp. MEB130]|uniref:helicase-related protein n=1 Tax=Alkalihalobacillus sp. MEB130 TaxID=2976704 RepID=UPI0028DF8D59|nr:helicase-related protein [Alkalihalobacillus sp. MEB130]MDT8861566.1 helicase-related protein [Alkalihalobacillus sp. MEB130]